MSKPSLSLSFARSERHSAFNSASQPRQSNQKQVSRPTDDEIGDVIKVQAQGSRAYFRGCFWRYKAGRWSIERNIDWYIWEAMRAAKPRGYKPTKGNAASIRAYLETQLFVPDEAVDSGDHLVNLRNGMYNLQTGVLEPHQRELYHTAQLDFAYDPEAECALWLHCLNQWLTTADGQPDPELHAVLQEALGYSFTAEVKYEVAFWLYGRAGSGKSRVVDMVQRLLGTACTSLDLSVLEKNAYQVADIAGKRVATCTEADGSSRLADALLKQMISGEELVARQIYAPSFRFRPKAKIWWAMNERPHNADRSNAIYRRLIILPFMNVIPEGQRDPDLSLKLSAELPGIFNWALEGLWRLRAQGHFTVAQQVQAQVQDYQQVNDTEAVCLADPDWFECVPEGVVRASDLYVAYKAWCDQFGHRAKSSTQVAAEWRRLGLAFEKRTPGNYYRGAVLTEYAAEIVAQRQKR